MSTKGYKHTSEAREKIKQSKLNKKFPNLSKALKAGFQKGRTTWNKGLTSKKDKRILAGEKHCNWGKHCSKKIIRKISDTLKGKHSSPKTEFKKGSTSWNKGIKCPQSAGKNHYNWKGGISKENNKARQNLEIRLWKRAVLERDNFTCQKYGIKGGKLNVHHINNFSEFPELRTSIDNGITLSDKAHRRFHKIYGKRNNTKEQIIEFLNNL